MSAAAFLDYGAERGARPRRTPELFNGGVKAPSPLEAKLAERGRLARGYRAWKRKERRRLIEAEPRLLGFIKFVRKVQAESADELIEAVGVCDWLLNADQATRIFALETIQKRADRINLLSGLPVFSDPLSASLQDPAQPLEVSVWGECHKLLTARGRL